MLPKTSCDLMLLENKKCIWPVWPSWNSVGFWVWILLLFIYYIRSKIEWKEHRVIILTSIHYRYNRIICRKRFSYVVWELKTNLFVEKRKKVLLADYFIAQVNADNFRHVCSRCLEFIHYKCLSIATRLKKLELSFKSQDLGAKIIAIL